MHIDIVHTSIETKTEFDESWSKKEMFEELNDDSMAWHEQLGMIANFVSETILDEIFWIRDRLPLC